MDKNREALANHPLFAGMGASDVETLADCASQKSFKAGTYIFKQGKRADRCYLLLQGLVSVEIQKPTQGALLLQSVRTGEALGWSWLFPPYQWQFDARVVEDIRAVVLDARCLRGKCDENPALGYDLMKRFAGIMVQRLQATRLQVLDLYGDPS